MLSPALAMPTLAADARLALRVATAFAVAFLVTTLAGDAASHLTGHDHLGGLLPLFSVRVEGNLPTFFQALLLAACALLCARKRWLSLAAVFLFLAFDEASGLHEMMNAPLRDALGTSGLLHFPWVIPYAVLTAAVAVVHWRLLLGLPAWAGVRIAAAGVLYVGGALGTAAARGVRYTLFGPDATYFVLGTVGEALEMAGLLLFLSVLLALRQPTS